MRYRYLLLLSIAFSCNQPKTKELKKIEVAQRVLLKGDLKLEQFFGAPGFGEDTLNDRKELTYMLHLDQPILFRDTDMAKEVGYTAQNTPFDTVSVVQVNLGTSGEGKRAAIEAAKDRKVEIECTLYGAVNGHDHAPAGTINVINIKKQ